MKIFDKINSIVKKKRCTLLGVGPMSKNVIDASINISNKKNFPLILIASRRQIDSKEFGGGYVENWDTETYSKYVKKRIKNDNLIMARDHGGPWQNNKEIELKLNINDAMKSSKRSFACDIDCGFKILHLDPSLSISGSQPKQDVVLKRIFELYEYCWDYARSKKKEIIFENGTEEQSGSTNSDYELEYTLSEMHKFCKKNKLPPVSFVVIQAGTKVMELENVGSFESHTRIKDEIPVEIQLLRMIEICNKNNVLMKEHNTDYLSNDSLNWHPKLGIHSANVAPEFAVSETKALLRLFADCNMNKEKDIFLKIAYESGKWKKWMIKNSKSDDLKKSIISGHYVFSNKKVLQLKDKLRVKLKKRKIDLDKLLVNEIEKSITRYTSAFKLSH